MENKKDFILYIILGIFSYISFHAFITAMILFIYFELKNNL